MAATLLGFQTLESVSRVGLKSANLLRMGEFLSFWLTRIAGAVFEYRLLKSDDQGFRVGLIAAGLVIVGCLIAMSIYA
ncbi:hypothetical protein [Variovorax sp. GB1P17]|uniref:hypothetical protein n=1 Tax=Variovorax sp. GB1P17 TaxID=3443740 RepID=UPI003F48AFBD